MKFKAMAEKRLLERFGKRGLEAFSESTREQLLLAEAALLVLVQAGEKYTPAQELIRSICGWANEGEE